MGEKIIGNSLACAVCVSVDYLSMYASPLRSFSRLCPSLPPFPTYRATLGSRQPKKENFSKGSEKKLKKNIYSKRKRHIHIYTNSLNKYIYMKKWNILFCVFRRLRYCHSSFIIDVCQYVIWHLQVTFGLIDVLW